MKIVIKSAYFFLTDCSSSTSTNAYCDQMLESLLGLVVGVPDPNAGPTDTTSPSLSDSNGIIKQMLSQLKVRGKNGSNGPGDQSPSDDPNVTQVSSLRQKKHHDADLFQLFLDLLFFDEFSDRS